MSIEGWYYLHTNGTLIYKRELGGTAADIRDSNFAVALWPCDPRDRATAWGIVVEALCAGALPVEVERLAAKWGCDDEDAHIYAQHVGATLERDGETWRAARKDDDQPYGRGATAREALSSLASALGYRPSKMWGASFADLLKTT
jgi:hypothetical protein